MTAMEEVSETMMRNRPLLSSNASRRWSLSGASPLRPVETRIVCSDPSGNDVDDASSLLRFELKSREKTEARISSSPLNLQGTKNKELGCCGVG